MLKNIFLQYHEYVLKFNQKIVKVEFIKIMYKNLNECIFI